jgi:hypothetical protein
MGGAQRPGESTAQEKGRVKVTRASEPRLARHHGIFPGKKTRHMAQLQITIWVSAHDALLAGETSAGEQSIPVTASLLAELSAEERVTLAQYCGLS